MNLELQDRVAVVFGGARGIGRAIAEGFAAEGARVVVCDIAPETADLEARSQAAGGPPLTGRVVDATKLPNVESASRSIVESHGRCDAVIYAAGIGSGQFGFPFWNVDPSRWPRVFEVNVYGAVHVAHAFRESLTASQGSLLFLSSVAGQIGSQTDPPYSAAKAAVLNFMQCAARDFAPFGVRVNAICPGMVKTDLNRSVFEAWASRQSTDVTVPSYEAWAEEKIRRVVPLGRWQTAEDIAAAALFLSSPRAANVTGQQFNVDGGFVMR
ncbi:MAG TPA: SDR family oxidoreductase [Pirellulaceae bacterium]|nr:SDR family oxidoreductase [Pirellulaceae bacterium]